MYAEAKDKWETMNQPQPSPNPEHKEGPIARAVEQQTAKIPSDIYLMAALGSMGVSALLQVLGARTISNFVGLWAPSFLMLGLYNKMVKLLGSDGEPVQ